MNRLWLTLLLPGLACGCSGSSPPAKPPINLDPAVRVVHAEVRTVKRTVEQPGVIIAYERTALYAKVSGFVKKWHVDIGHMVKKGAILVELTAPELVAQHDQMKAQVELDKSLVDQSKKQDLVAQRNVKAAVEQIAQAQADVERYKADVQRWESEVKRLTTLVGERVVDQQVLDETRRQPESSQATFKSAQAYVRTREAEHLSADATRERTNVDISAAEHRVRVAQADERRLAALVDYLTIYAPYDAVVTARNVNTADFVLPATGDPTQGASSIGVSSSNATPLYLLNRIDPVLFDFGVPEADSPYVEVGSKVLVRIPEMNLEIPMTVTRTSRALNPISRTLQTQVDLPNADGRFLPGMYAYGSVLIERKDVHALPVAAVTLIGNQTYCYVVVAGKAVRTPVQIGVSDGSWVEVKKRFVPADGSSEGKWIPFDGKEPVLVGDMTEITDGTRVNVAPNGDSVKADSGK